LGAPGLTPGFVGVVRIARLFIVVFFVFA